MKIDLRKTNNKELSKLLGRGNIIKLNEELDLMVSSWSLDIVKDNKAIVRGRKNVIKYIKENNIEVIIKENEVK